MPKLTKAEIIQASSDKIGFTKHESTKVLETLLEILKRQLESGDDVLVSGFGKFCVQKKNARRGINPAKGEDLMLRPRRIVTFRCSGKLRERINKNK